MNGGSDKLKKSKILWHQNGISLLEVLAVTILISLISIFIFNILTSGQKQYNNQQANNQSQQNISYALKVLTKEIRQNPETINVISASELEIDGVLYKLNGTDLMQNSTILVNNIEEFEVLEDSNAISIRIVSTSGVEVSTQIAKRS